MDEEKRALVYWGVAVVGVALHSLAVLLTFTMVNSGAVYELNPLTRSLPGLVVSLLAPPFLYMGMWVLGSRIPYRSKLLAAAALTVLLTFDFSHDFIIFQEFLTFIR